MLQPCLSMGALLFLMPHNLPDPKHLIHSPGIAQSIATKHYFSVDSDVSTFPWNATSTSLCCLREQQTLPNPLPLLLPLSQNLCCFIQYMVPMCILCKFSVWLKCQHCPGARVAGELQRCCWPGVMRLLVPQAASRLT